MPIANFMLSRTAFIVETSVPSGRGTTDYLLQPLRGINGRDFIGRESMSWSGVQPAPDGRVVCAGRETSPQRGWVPFDPMSWSGDQPITGELVGRPAHDGSGDPGHFGPGWQ